MKAFAICLAALALGAGCASSGGSNLRTASARLDDTSQAFYRQLATDPAPRSTVEDASVFADAARDFERDVRESRSRDVLAPGFERVADRYHRLRDQLDDRDYGNRYREAGFDRVTEAYLDVERAMNKAFGDRYTYRN